MSSTIANSQWEELTALRAGSHDHESIQTTEEMERITGESFDSGQI